MSLINSVLRDLDKRRAGDEARKGLPNVVRPLPEAQTSAAPAKILGLVLVLLLVAGGGWWLIQADQTSPAADPVALPPIAAVPPAPTIVAAPAIAAAPTAAAVSPPGFQAEVRHVDIALAANTEESPAPKTSAAEVSREKKSPEASPAQSPLKPASPPGPPIGQLRLDARLFMPPAPRMNVAPVAEQKAIAAPGAPGAAVIPGAAESEGADWRRAQVLLREGKLDQAEPLLRQSLQQQPGNAAARQALLGILMPARRHADAVEVLSAGLAITPAQVGWAMNLARIHAEQNDYPAAWEALSRTAPHAEQNPDYQAFCGTVLQRLNRSGEALPYYRNALRLKPDEGRWWAGYGIALEAAGKSSEARESYLRARAVGSLSPEVSNFIDQKVR